MFSEEFQVEAFQEVSGEFKGVLGVFQPGTSRTM